MKDWNLFKYSLINKGRKHKDGSFTSSDIFTFDIETTSFMVNRTTFEIYSILKTLEKTQEDHNGKITRRVLDGDTYELGSYCYIWMFSHNQDVYYGRTLEEYVTFITRIQTWLIDKNVFINVYCHNLSFEFQHIHKLFTFTEVIARKLRKVMSCKNGNIQYKCSYMLSGSGLENTVKKFNLNTKKLVGNLEYNKFRHHETELTVDEMNYCKHDCLALYEYIKYEKKQNKVEQRKRIPLTSTGKIRHKLKKSFDDGYMGIRFRQEEVAKLTPTPKLFKELRLAFSGGYTHANHYNVNILHKNVVSYDLKSDYPSQMFTKKFPQDNFIDVSRETFSLEELSVDEEYAYIIDVEFIDIESVNENNYISISKCTELTNFTNQDYTENALNYDNGRLTRAEKCRITITEQDLFIIINNYVYMDYIIHKIQKSKKDYLPIEILQLIEELFAQKESYSKKLKTLQKGTDEHESCQSNLKQVKEYINSIYGMSVTNYVSDTIEYKDYKWNRINLTDNMIQEQLEKLKEDMTLMLPYQIGVWVTSYARKCLWDMIGLINEDVVYCDTDSVKFLNPEKWERCFLEYNEKQIEKNKEQCKRFNLNEKILCNLGVWELDGKYTEFKTMGAKKYCYRNEKGELNITVSGVPKKGAICLDDDINNFKQGFQFDFRADKKTAVYQDNYIIADITDHRGVTARCISPSGIALYNEYYTLSLSKDFFYHLQFLEQESRLLGGL